MFLQNKYRFTAVIALALFCTLLTSKAQRFNWQYSARMPSDYPLLFLGGGFSTGEAFHIGSFASIEGPISCAQYNEGSGSFTNFHLSAEWWQRGDIAYTASVAVNSVKGNFIAPFSYPTRNGTITSAYELQTTLRFFMASAGIKYRIPETYLFVSGSAGVGVLLSSTFSEREYIVSPAEASWANGLQERFIGNGGIGGVQRIALEGKAHIGYDFSPVKNFYIVPQISFSYMPVPLIDSWQIATIGGSVTLFYAIQ